MTTIHSLIPLRNRKSKGKNKKDAAEASAASAADGAIAAAAAAAGAMSNEDAVDGAVAGTENGASSSSPDQESVVHGAGFGAYFDTHISELTTQVYFNS